MEWWGDVVGPKDHTSAAVHNTTRPGTVSSLFVVHGIGRATSILNVFLDKGRRKRAALGLLVSFVGCDKGMEEEVVDCLAVGDLANRGAASLSESSVEEEEEEEEERAFMLIG